MGIFDKLFGKQSTVQKVDPSPAGGTSEEQQRKQEPVHQEPIDYNTLIDDLVAQIPLEPTPIGNPEPICPYCNATLPKMPQRSIKCPSCGNKIRLETRPYDGQRVLATLQQAEEIRSQQRRLSEGYQEWIEILKRDLSGYQELGLTGWQFLAALDETEKPEFVRLHGKIFKFGSIDEIDALKLMIRPDSRCCPLAFIDDTDADDKSSKFKEEREEWFEKMGLEQ